MALQRSLGTVQSYNLPLADEPPVIYLKSELGQSLLWEALKGELVQQLDGECLLPPPGPLILVAGFLIAPISYKTLSHSGGAGRCSLEWARD